VLRAIKRYYIANQQCSTITSADIIAFANQLVSKVAPQTVANYLSHLAAVFAIVPAGVGFQLDQNAMKDAFVVAKRLGITTKSRDKLKMHFGERLKRRPPSVPMQRITAFAIFFRRIGWRKSLASTGPTLMPEEVGC